MLKEFATGLSTLTSPLRNLISSPTWVFTVPGRVLGLSLPVRAGLGMFVVLSLTVTAVWWVQVHTGWDPHRRDGWDMRRASAFAAVIFATSVLAGICTHYWLMQVPALYPDIYRAWTDGLAEIQAHQIRLESSPIYMMLGFPDRPSAEALMHASKMTVLARQPGTGHLPLLWYACENSRGETGLFLFLSTCCPSSLLIGGQGLEQVGGGGGGQQGGQTFVDQARNFAAHSIQFFQGAARKKTPRPVSGTSFAGDEESSMNLKQRPLPQHSLPALGTGNFDGELPTADSRPAPGVQRLKAERSALAQNEMWYVCQLLKGARQPVCPLNGLVVAVPFSRLADGGQEQAEILSQTVRGDLRQLTMQLGLRAHAVALVTGLDKEHDFEVFLKRTVELQELSGRSAEDYLNCRLGKGLEPWVEPKEDRLEQLAQVACGSIENQVYNCLKVTRALSKTDNGQLYRFLAKVRGRLAPNLQRWIVSGFSWPSHEKHSNTSSNDNSNLQDLPRFSGCYLLAAANSPTGEVDQEPRISAFVSGVFDKLFELNGDLEWTKESLDRDRWYAAGVQILLLLTLAGWIIIGLVAYLMWDAPPKSANASRAFPAHYDSTSSRNGLKPSSA